MMRTALGNLVVVCAAGVCALVPGFANPTSDAAKPASCVVGSWRVVSGFPEEAPVRFETEHFAFRWKGNDADIAMATAAGRQMETIWTTYLAAIRFPEPFCDRADKHKANINIDPNNGLSGGSTGERDMGMWINPAALKDHWGLAHEFTHALQGSTRGLRSELFGGWIWESHANWMAHQMPEYRDEVHCSEMLVNWPHLYFGSTRDRYCNWQFWEYLKDRFGYEAVNVLWKLAKKPGEPGAETEDPFDVLMRSRGWTIQQLNDFFGDWAARNVTWDYVGPDGYDSGPNFRARYGSYDDKEGDRALRLTALDPMDLKRRRFHVPAAWAPQRWGYNLVRLIPDAGAQQVSVTFRGIVQTKPAVGKLPGQAYEPAHLEDPHSDWRWSLVAVGADGKPRYGARMRGAKGQAALALKADDQALYLVVVGTPSAQQKIRWDQKYYAIYRYPWMAEFAGAWPQGFQPGTTAPMAGHRHPNGGGWVADTAIVDATVYVGPYARIFGGTVTGRARIEDHATIIDGTVSDDARIGGLTVLDRGIVVKDRAVVSTVFKGPGNFEPGVIVAGTAQVLGDAEVRNGVHLDHGVFYGYVDADTMKDPQQGANLVAPIPEVTAVPQFVWVP